MVPRSSPSAGSSSSPAATRAPQNSAGRRWSARGPERASERKRLANSPVTRRRERPRPWPLAPHGAHRGPQVLRDHRLPFIELSGDVEHAEHRHQVAVLLLLARAKLALYLFGPTLQAPQQLRLRSSHRLADGQHRVPPAWRPCGEFTADHGRRRLRLQPFPRRGHQGRLDIRSAARHLATYLVATTRRLAELVTIILAQSSVGQEARTARQRSSGPGRVVEVPAHARR